MRLWLQFVLITGTYLSSLSAMGSDVFIDSDRDENLTDLDTRVIETLTDRIESGRLVFHYRAGDWPDEQLRADVKANVDAFGELETLLDMKFTGRAHLFLYRDVVQMEELTGSGTFAFATGAFSIHQVRDFRGVHELAHLFALQFPAHPDRFSDPFVVEGLATGLSEFESGAPLHAWCATYARLGCLPGLWDLRRTFPDGAPAGVHPYHVAGSFVRFLIETYGIGKVKRWYVNALEAEVVFERNFVRLEWDWLSMLSALDVDLSHEQVVLKRIGGGRERLPESLAAIKGDQLFDGLNLEGWKASGPDEWSARGGLISGRRKGPWSVLRRPIDPAAQVGLRVRFRLVEGRAFKLVFFDAEGKAAEAIFAAYASFMTAGEGFAGDENLKIREGFWNNALFLNDRGRGRLYLNCTLLFDMEDVFTPGTVAIGLGIEEGAVEVAAVELIDLK